MPETTTTTAEAPVWAIIELMGHIRYGGQVSKDHQFGTAMLRVDVPQEDGSFVSQLVNPSSIYRLTMCSEELGRAAAAAGNEKPLHSWELPRLTTADEIDPDGPDEDDTNHAFPDF